MSARETQAGSWSSQIMIWLSVATFAACWLMPLQVTWATSSDLGHSWAVPLLIAYLWWERWDERPQGVARAPLGWWCWVLLGAFAVALLFFRLLLTPFPLWPMLLLAYTATLVVAALAVAWMAAGWSGVRWVGAPLILLLSALPAPSIVETSLIVPLRSAMAAAAAELSNWLGHPAIAVGTSVQLATGWVGIDEACGGIRSLQACFMIGLFFGEWFRFSWTRRSLLVLAAIGAALLGNFSRVLFLSLRVNAGADAAESIHDLAGWIAMGASLLLTGWLACRWAGYRWPQQLSVKRQPVATRQPWIWAATLAGLLLVNEAAVRWWFSQGEAQRSHVPQWTAQLPTEHWSFREQPLGKAAREMLRPDHFVAGRWQHSRDEISAAYYIEWRRGQVARFVPFLHNPTVCMPLSGCELMATLDPLAVPWDGLEIPFYVYRFRRAGEEMIVAYTLWDPTRGQPLNPTKPTETWLDWWRHQWREVVEHRQHQPAQMLAVSISETGRVPDGEALQHIIRKLIKPPSGL